MKIIDIQFGLIFCGFFYRDITRPARQTLTAKYVQIAATSLPGKHWCSGIGALYRRWQRLCRLCHKRAGKRHFTMTAVERNCRIQ